MNALDRSISVAVVGGGLAGLAAATILAKGGLSVTLFERPRHLGGRAATQGPPGYALNLGPHALHRGGEGSACCARSGSSLAAASPRSTARERTVRVLTTFLAALGAGDAAGSSRCSPSRCAA